jgi:hypothetical protein
LPKTLKKPRFKLRKVVSLIFEDNLENEAAIEQIIQAYKQQFQQESVLQVVDEELQVILDTDQGYDSWLGAVAQDTLTGAAGQNSFHDAIASTDNNIDFVAAHKQILLPGLDFEGIQGEAAGIYSDQLTLEQTTDDAGDPLIDNNIFEEYFLPPEQI